MSEIQPRIQQNNKYEGEPEQLLLGLKDKPDLKEKYRRTQFRISILGGDESGDDAEKLGYDLVRNWYSITTGGYDDGTMKRALEGGNRALQELQSESVNRQAFEWFSPTVIGITTESFKKLEPVRGEHIINKEAENPYDRLRQLIEDSEVAIILAGGSGTMLEALADLVFNKKLGSNTRRPTIFVGDTWGTDSPIGKAIDKSNNVYRVNNIDEAIRLVEELFGRDKKLREERWVKRG